MAKSLLEQLPEIVARGRQVAEKILKSLEGRHRVSLQTREWVLPAKDVAAQDWIADDARRVQREAAQQAAWVNRLIYGDNLLAMIAPRLILMRELLSETGAIYVHLDWHVGHYVKLPVRRIG